LSRVPHPTSGTRDNFKPARTPSLQSRGLAVVEKGDSRSLLAEALMTTMACECLLRERSGSVRESLSRRPQLQPLISRSSSHAIHRSRETRNLPVIA
jgi:hypothetical protein